MRLKLGTKIDLSERFVRFVRFAGLLDLSDIRFVDFRNLKNPKVRLPTELIMDPFEEGGVLRVRVV